MNATVPTSPIVKGSSLEGLWVVLVPEDGEKVPLLARAGDGLYLLAFKSGVYARNFIAQKGLEGAEERMVVRANLAAFTRYMNERGVSGVLIDYDAATNTYRDADLLS